MSQLCFKIYIWCTLSQEGARKWDYVTSENAHKNAFLVYIKEKIEKNR